jgi:membrane fusion protein, multidrug efflux system
MRGNDSRAQSLLAERRWKTGAALCLIALAATWSGCKDDRKAPVMPPMDVLVTQVKAEDVPVYREWVATTDGYINAQIRAKVQGYLLSRDYKEGSVVKAGDVLFQLDPRQFKAALDQAAGDVARNEAMLLKSKQDVARYTPLAAEGAVSQKELDDAIQAMEANQAAVDSAKAAVEQARLNLEWTRITSPINGVAGIAVAQVGDLIGQASQLTTVSQLEPIKVYFPISEQEYLGVAKIVNEIEEGVRKPRPILEMKLSDGSIYPHPGKIDVANRQVDVRTGTIQIQALFPNPDNILRPGQFGRVRATVDTLKNAVVIPQRAVADVQGQYQVVVVGADNKAEIRTVELGEKTGTGWVVRKGLKDGERIVAEGLQKIRNGMTVNPKPYASTTPAAVEPKA